MARHVDTALAHLMADALRHQIDAPVWVSFHTGPAEPIPHAWVAANGDITWLRAPTTIARGDPFELDMNDATSTGVGDPFADVLRSIDNVLAVDDE